MSDVGLDATPDDVGAPGAGGEPDAEKSVIATAVATPGSEGVVGPENDPAGLEAAKAAAEAEAGKEPPKEEPPKEEPPKEDEYEEYELSTSENSPLSQEDLDHIAGVAAKYGMTKEEAQDMVTLKEQALGSHGELEAMRAEHAAHKSQVMAMPEFASDKVAETNLMLSKVATTFGDADFAKLITGPAGSHPGLVKLLLNIGKSMKSDTIVGKDKINGGGAPKSVQEIMYPQFFKEEK